VGGAPAREEDGEAEAVVDPGRDEGAGPLREGPGAVCRYLGPIVTLLVAPLTEMSAVLGVPSLTLPRAAF